MPQKVIQIPPGIKRIQCDHYLIAGQRIIWKIQEFIRKSMYFTYLWISQEIYRFLRKYKGFSGNLNIQIPLGIERIQRDHCLIVGRRHLECTVYFLDGYIEKFKYKKGFKPEFDSVISKLPRDKNGSFSNPAAHCPFGFCEGVRNY